MNIFNPESGIFQAFGKMFDLIVLNIVFIISCIPVFTIGAGVTAMYYVTLKMVKNEESYIVKSYLKSFRQNLKQATAIWLLLLAFLLLNIGGIYQTWNMSGMGQYVRCIFVAMLIFEAFVFCYVFPVLSRFDNSVKNIIKYSMMMVARHFPWSVLLLVINLCPVILFLLLSGRIQWFLVGVILVLGFSTVAFACSWCFVEKIFPFYMPEEAKELTEE